MFGRCDLVSISAAWSTVDQRLEISLAYGFDDGVYAVATMRGDAISAVSLAQ